MCVRRACPGRTKLNEKFTHPTPGERLPMRQLAASSELMAKPLAPASEVIKRVSPCRMLNGTSAQLNSHSGSMADKTRDTGR